MPGDDDGNGKTDFAVYRPSAGPWYLGGPSPAAVLRGIATDEPTLLPTGILGFFF